MCDVAGRCGAEVVRVDAPWGRPLDPQALLDAHPSPALIAAVHAETSTGVRNDVALPRPGPAPPGRRGAGAGRLRDLARRHPRRDRRLGCRPGLQRHPEVPRRAAGSGTADRGRARGRTPGRAAAVVVPRPQHAGPLRHRRGRPRVPPHRADLDDLRPARGLGRGARRGARSLVGTTPPVRRGAAGRPGRARVRAVRGRGPPPARADDRLGAHRPAAGRARRGGGPPPAARPLRHRDRRRAWASSPAGCGASAAWATPPDWPTWPCCSARWARCWPHERAVRASRRAAAARRVGLPGVARGPPPQRRMADASGSRRASPASPT